MPGVIHVEEQLPLVRHYRRVVSLVLRLVLVGDCEPLLVGVLDDLGHLVWVQRVPDVIEIRLVTLEALR